MKPVKPVKPVSPKAKTVSAKPKTGTCKTCRKPYGTGKNSCKCKE